MNIFGIGLPEMIVIMVVALLIFGPKKLPEIGRSLGKTIKSFQDASKDFQDEINKTIEPAQSPVVSQPPTTAVATSPEPVATTPPESAAETTAEVEPKAEVEAQAVSTEAQEQPSTAEA